MLKLFYNAFSIVPRITVLSFAIIQYIPDLNAQQYKLSAEQQSAVEVLEKQRPGIDILWNTKFHVPLRINAINSQPLESKPAAISSYFVENFSNLYKIRRPDQDIVVGKLTTQRKGFKSLTLFQQHNNIMVYGISLKLRLDDSDRLQSISGKWIPDITVDTKPTLNKQQALDGIISFLRKENKTGKALPADLKLQPTTFRLVVFNSGIYTNQTATSHLAYHVIVQSHVYFVSAHTGEVLYQYSNIQTARDRETYISDHCLTLPGTLILDESGPVGGAVPDTETQNAHDAASTVYDYYLATHGRDSYNNAGATIVSTVHSGVMTNLLCCLGLCDCCTQVNAAWMLPPIDQMVYGDGGTLDDGRSFHPFTNALDVVAHEITHGVTTHSIFDSGGDPVGLDYSEQSGALNESYSDFFGAMIDRADWLVGEDLVISGYPSGAMRNMADPTNGGLYDPADPQGSTDAGHQPDHMDNYVSGGDVHINSGIPNKVAYLISEGGTHPYSAITVSGIGREATEQILYDTLTSKLTQTSSFLEAREATLLASTELYPFDMDKFNTIWNAFIACGICDDSIPGDCEPHVPMEARDSVDIVLLLDYSDSMNNESEPGGRNKIDVLKDAVELFLRTWEIFAAPGDRADIVYFDSDVSPLAISLQPLDVDALIGEVRARPTGIYTAMGGALQVGLSGLSSGASHPSLILFTNGIQNVNPMAVKVGANYEIINDAGAWGGTSSVPPNPATTLASYGVPVHIIGIGAAAAGTYHELLNDIRLETGGELHLTTAPDIDLRRFYLDDLVSSLNLGTLEMADYQYEVLQPNQTAGLTFEMNGTVTRAAFTVHWIAQSGVQFPDIKIDGPFHSNLQPSYWVNGPFYKTAVFNFPYILDKKVIPRSGTWTLHVEQSANNAPVPYHASLLVDETVIHYEFTLPEEVVWAGDEFVLSTKVTQAGRPLTKLAVKAKMAFPRTALGSFLSENTYKITKERTDLLSTPAQNKLIGLLESVELRNKLIAQTVDLVLYDDGNQTHGDATADDGIYSTMISNTNLPGLFRFDIDINGTTANGWPVQRSQIVSTIVRVKPDPQFTRVVTQWLEIPSDGTGTMSAKFIPVDKFNNHLGPGYGHLFKLTVKGGELIDAIKDNLDGSYTQLIRPDPDQKGALTMNLLGTEISVPLEAKTSYNWLLWLVLAIILIVIIILIIRSRGSPQ